MTGQKQLLPLVARIAASSDLHLSLAAERTLEGFEGPEADAALLSCVQAWKYDTFKRAASALLERNPSLLNAGLLEADPPAKYRYWQGIFLGRLKNPACIPILCSTVRKISIIDREMFNLIEELAGPEHRGLVTALPDSVRDGQVERAQAVRAAVLARLDRD